MKAVMKTKVGTLAVETPENLAKLQSSIDALKDVCARDLKSNDMFSFQIHERVLKRYEDRLLRSKGVAR